jgi:hypothetical protein
MLNIPRLSLHGKQSADNFVYMVSQPYFRTGTALAILPLLLIWRGCEFNLAVLRRVVFVLKETQPEKWMNSGAGDFVAQLKPPDLSDVVDKVLDAEANYSHWSLFNRFCMANDLLDAADAAGEWLGF